MNKIQALNVSKHVLEVLAKTEFFSDKDEREFENRYGVSHAQVVNALPIINAMELVEGASYGN